MSKELDVKNSSLKEHENRVNSLGEQLEHLQRSLRAREASQMQLRDEVIRVEKEIMQANAKAGANQDCELRRILEEVSPKNIEKMNKLLSSKDEEIAKLRDEIRIISAHWKFKTKELESQEIARLPREHVYTVLPAYAKHLITEDPLMRGSVWYKMRLQGYKLKIVYGQVHRVPKGIHERNACKVAELPKSIKWVLPQVLINVLLPDKEKLTYQLADKLVYLLSNARSSDKPVAAATATTANKFHHRFTKSDDDDGFLRARRCWRSVYLAAVLEYLAAEETDRLRQVIEKEMLKVEVLVDNVLFCLMKLSKETLTCSFNEVHGKA
ncbi:hypothetical protein Syun_017705 [Stephania yunnanensis]|uniref:Uncharacterized protein n=1 Tax=Stephania yunnanensis TaxID=152371 RepID=A0AAP0J7J0_9MAGN